jgi:hypothetical protein
VSAGAAFARYFLLLFIVHDTPDTMSVDSSIICISYTARLGD